jgi:two-component system nitrogen regulation response regulator NtrX
MNPSILIVDDEPSILQSLGGLLTDEGFDVHTASNGYEALKNIESNSPDLVLLDIWMPGLDGIDTLQEIRKNNLYIQVIIITGHGTIETAVKATKMGSYDLIEKPLSIDKVIVAINNALNYRRLEEENRYLRKKMIEKNSISGNSPPIQLLKKQVSVAAPTDTWILIKGENGTGKELVARTIHQLSRRASHPLITVNCAAIPEELIESELFGHEKGAFPGASMKKRGKFELAHSGTIFLDEIGDMSLRTQSKMLRVLEEQKFNRLGGSRTITVDVRVIAATNKDLEKEIENGQFREELYYRLNVVPIEVPPLRERKEDIPVLVDIFFEEFAKQNQKEKKKMTPSALEQLRRSSWQGNIRELKNLVERLVIMVEKDSIDIEDLPDTYQSETDSSMADNESGLLSIDTLKQAKKEFEREYIQKKLEENKNNISRTAEMIGVGRSYLYKKIKKVIK